MQEPKIKICHRKTLAGKYLQMCINNDRTFELFSNFIPKISQIADRISAEKYCVRIYPESYNFKQFDLNATFEKWAVVEVSDTKSMPAGMEELIIEEGLYAVFIHKGPASEGEKTHHFIFEQWLPNSGYTIDSRPHFDVLGEKYKNNHPDSEEEIWIPIKNT